MKFLAQRSDGEILGRFDDDKVTFPIPSDVVVFDFPTNVSERDLPNGSNLSTFTAAKLSAFRSFHPEYDYSIEECEELIVVNCDLAHSSLTTRGPGKTTMIRPGGKLVSSTISCDTNVGICMRYHSFIMGSPTDKQNLRYYNFDEDTQAFVTPPDLTAAIVDAVDPSLVLENVTYDEEGSIGYFPDFRIALWNLNSTAVFVSDWILITKRLLEV